MSFGFFDVSSNTATVTDVKAAKETLNNYHTFLDLKFAVKGEGGSGTIRVLKDLPEEADWPSAIRTEDVPDIVDDYEWWEAMDKLHEKDGEQQFNECLLSLAPHLITPFTVTAASFESSGHFYRAKQWSVMPGASVVEIKEIKIPKDEEESELLVSDSL